MFVIKKLLNKKIFKIFREHKTKKDVVKLANYYMSSIPSDVSESVMKNNGKYIKLGGFYFAKDYIDGTLFLAVRKDNGVINFYQRIYSRKYPFFCEKISIIDKLKEIKLRLKGYICTGPK